MDFINFATLVRDSIEKQTGDCYTVRLNDVRKNNGIVLTGITIMRDDSNISPTIYLNHYYEEYISGRTTFSSVVNNVMNTYRQNRVPHKVDIQYFLNYKDVKPRLVYKLINLEKNKELLEDIPHMEYLDLAIVFKCMVFHEELGDASILVRNAHMKLWGVTTEQLYQVAHENTKKLMPHKITPIVDIISRIWKEENPEGLDDEFIAALKNAVPLYVLSNKSRMEGASCMLYPNLIMDFANAANSNLYIIPSSIHELLLLPTENDEGCREIKSMIRDINNTQIIPEEILSYSLYFYNREIDKIVML